MLDSVIGNSLVLVERTETFIGKAKRLINSGNLDEAEAYNLGREIERLTDVIFLMDEATRFLRRMFEQRPEIARRCSAHPTVQ